MIFSNSVDESSKEYCKYDIKCQVLPTNHCERYGEMYYLEDQRKVVEHLQYVQHKHHLLNENLKLLMSKLSSNMILDLVEEICQFKVKSKDIEKRIEMIKEEFNNIIHQDKKDLKEQLMKINNGIKIDQNGSLENDIQRLEKDIHQVKLILEEMSYLSKEQLYIQSDHFIQTMKSTNQISNIRSHFCTSENIPTQQSDDIPVLSHSSVKRTNSSIININQNQVNLNQTENERYLQGEEEEEEDQIGVIASKITPRISRKIRLSNNFVSWLRGPFRIIVDAPMRLAELCAQERRVNDNIIQTINKGLLKQEQTNNHLFKSVFAEITEEWTFEGKNSDRGFNSASIWMHDPHGKRILVKMQDHPLCAANEWLAFILGKQLGLLVNQVQIAIYQNHLVTLHTDVNQQNENIFSFIDLPRKVKKSLLTDPTMQCMDLFDHILQNVDRNPRNILITIPNTNNINDVNAKFKVHLIDHSSCFGMGKLNVISAVACKFHSQHLCVIKFNPIDQANLFKRYIKRLTIGDRIIIKNILNRFAAITDQQIDTWINEIQDLLSSSQFNRIHQLLYRQRDIVRHYTIQWGISTTYSNVKSNENKHNALEINDTIF